MSPDEIEDLFRYHPHKPGEIPKLERLRAAGSMMAKVIAETTPSGPEQDEAIRRARESLLWATAGVLRG